MDLFTNRAPNATQAAAMDRITAGMLALEAVLAAELTPSRFTSLALTKLEECSMWAKKSVVFAQ